MAREVGSLSRRNSRNGQVTTAEIKELVFEQLDQLARRSDKLYEDDVKDRARLLKNEWEKHELIKKDQRWALERIEALERECAEVNGLLEAEKLQSHSLAAELASVRKDLREIEKAGKNGPSTSECASDAYKELEKDYGNYFPSLAFSIKALKRLTELGRAERRLFESKFRLLQDKKADAKHEVPRTSPLTWQLDVGREGRLYFQRDGATISVVLIGTKGSQPADYEALRKKESTKVGL